MCPKNKRLLIYEGMAKWVEIQYLYLVGETAVVRREEYITRNREYEYGIFYPDDLHKPGLMHNRESTPIRKILMKIEVIYKNKGLIAVIIVLVFLMAEISIYEKSPD